MSSTSEEEVIGGDYFNQELEAIVRTVLGNLDSLQPFSSSHFNVFPYINPCKEVSQVICTQCDDNLRAYPYVIVLYLEKNMEKERPAKEELSSEIETVSEPQSKRRRTDKPRERSILKDAINEFLDESATSETDEQHVDNFCMEGEAKKDPGQVDKKETKGLVEPQQKSDVSTTRGTETPSEEEEEDDDDKDDEEEDEDDNEEEEEEDASSVQGSAVKPGFLTRLARLAYVGMYTYHQCKPDLQQSF
ncbi:membrane-anchored junction protein isoform X2 [Xyrichtys novacula]|uniref:Membrane-anchored junction protein isoform X2 n=1 Tax=Xyrichtys novacula TaxID=13765 RepID=A0AAV1HPW8_XYRNO|nr:membrane-anchored junction protein isoform X2 [Xyrichtys novacula]